jgi:signal transduction histidine kinase
MLLNLVLNAADAGCNRGTVLVRAVPAPDNVVIEVHDNGPGIPASEREKIFHSLYTTKPDGTGLGLLAVQACAKTHQGHIQVLSSGLGGACFSITLPLHAPKEEQPA